GADVQREQAEFPKAIIAAGGNIGEVKRRGAEPPHAAGRRRDPCQGREISRMVAAAAERDAGADQRIAELAPRRYPEAAVVEIGADALLGPEHLVAGRLVDQAGNDLAVAFERDRDREMWDAVQEAGGAVARN